MVFKNSLNKYNIYLNTILIIKIIIYIKHLITSITSCIFKTSGWKKKVTE